MDEYIVTCLEDVLNACNEVESYFVEQPKLYRDFAGDMMKIRAVERNVEIMGEALNRIHKLEPDFIIPNARAVIQTRNRVIHGYDSVTPEFLWSLVIKHIPALKADVETIISNM